MDNAKKVLVVEDDDIERELMSMTLERRGFSVAAAENGLQAYDQALSSPPDLIVTDISMPSADGVHLIRRVRDTPAIAKTPILVTTGFGTGSATFSLAAGADAYEPKPLDPERFVATVERMLYPRIPRPRPGT